MEVRAERKETEGRAEDLTDAHIASKGRAK